MSPRAFDTHLYGHHIHLNDILQQLHLPPLNDYSSIPKKEDILSFSPIDGAFLGHVHAATTAEIDAGIAHAHAAFLQWRQVPAPHRGELIRLFGEELRQHKTALGQLVTLEMGKIAQEGLGEVQEMIDICDFAQGLSRQLYGLTISSERPGHRMMETWHPLGVIGLITPFNFPVAVWAWNFALAIVCGNSTIWKPSEKTPLTAMACQGLFQRALDRFETAPPSLSILIHGGKSVGEQLAKDQRIPLVSATGSAIMGRAVATTVAQRFGRSLLELGGNNAMIVMPSADIEMAIRAIVFSAVGTTGQRCTSLRRLLIHQSIYADLIARLHKIYPTLRIGNPLAPETLCGPLIDETAFEMMNARLSQAQQEGGKVYGGNRILADIYPNAYYVEPAFVEIPTQTEAVMTETFAPIMYVMPFDNLEQAIALNNAAKEGLSSCIFTQNVRESEFFMSAMGSDCGIVNVNIGPSGAEIGGAFGGEKETGGGRESGSDAWRQYMRRATNTINFSTDLPLAQGIRFDW